MAVLSLAKDHRTCIQVSYYMLRSAVMVQTSFSLRVKTLSQMNLWLGVAGLQVSRVYHWHLSNKTAALALLQSFSHKYINIYKK